jgi:flagellar basal-body rod protein FlgG
MGTGKVTNNALDIMIEGPGFFPIQLPDGQIGYTRNGAFKKDGGGKIVDGNGFALQPEITVPPEATGLQISQDGQVGIISGVTTNVQTLGQIQLVNFVNPAGLKAMGKNVFLPTSASGIPLQGVPGQGGLGYLSQGQLEQSNVNIVDEMVNMITAQRSYETNSKVIQAADQMLQYMNNLR